MIPSSITWALQFTEAYRQYANDIARHCGYQLRNTDDGEELMQDTFMRAWEYLKAGKNIENMRTFLYSVAHNLVIDEIRRRKRKEGVSSLDALQEKGFDPGTQNEVDQHHKRVDVWQVLLNLERQEYDLLVMRYLDGKSTADIATHMGISPNAVSLRLHRAMKYIARNALLRERNRR